MQTTWRIYYNQAVYKHCKRLILWDMPNSADGLRFDQTSRELVWLVCFSTRARISPQVLQLTWIKVLCDLLCQNQQRAWTCTMWCCSVMWYTSLNIMGENSVLGYSLEQLAIVPLGTEIIFCFLHSWFSEGPPFAFPHLSHRHFELSGGTGTLEVLPKFLQDANGVIFQAVWSTSLRTGAGSGSVSENETSSKKILFTHKGELYVQWHLSLKCDCGMIIRMSVLFQIRVIQMTFQIKVILLVTMENSQHGRGLGFKRAWIVHCNANNLIFLYICPTTE